MLTPGSMDLDGNNELSRYELAVWVNFTGLDFDKAKVPTFVD